MTNFVNLQLSADSTLAEVVAALDGAGMNGITFETWYDTAHAKDPSLTPYQAAPIWLVGQGVSTGLGSAATAVGTATGQAAQGATTGADEFAKSLSVPNFLGLLTNRQLWIRVAEGLLGIMLVLVAVAELGKGTAIGTAVKAVPFI
jgi:hypothetical protein